MKKFIALVLSALCLLTFFGCGTEKTDTALSDDGSVGASVESSVDTTVEPSVDVTSSADSSEQSEETSAPNESIDNMTKDGFEVSVAYANWTEPEDVFESALNAGMMNSETGRHYPVFKFDTAEELAQFKLSFADKLTMTYGYDEVPSFNDVTAGYDEAFFSENTIVLVYVDTSSGSFRYDVSNVSMISESFTVYIEESLPGQDIHGSGEIMVTEDMAGWFVILEVPDYTAEKFTKFDAVDKYTE